MEEALTAAPVLIPCIAALALALLVVRRRLEAGVPAYELFRQAGLAASNGEARRLVKGGGSLMDFGTVMGDVELHQIWLSNGTYRIEATALSPHGNATLAAVGDSIAASLRG